jgi:hypothetical protein
MCNHPVRSSPRQRGPQFCRASIRLDSRLRGNERCETRSRFHRPPLPLILPAALRIIRA